MGGIITPFVRQCIFPSRNFCPLACSPEAARLVWVCLERWSYFLYFLFSLFLSDAGLSLRLLFLVLWAPLKLPSRNIADVCCEADFHACLPQKAWLLPFSPPVSSSRQPLRCRVWLPLGVPSWTLIKLSSLNGCWLCGVLRWSLPFNSLTRRENNPVPVQKIGLSSSSWELRLHMTD